MNIYLFRDPNKFYGALYQCVLASTEESARELLKGVYRILPHEWILVKTKEISDIEQILFEVDEIM